jgi:hypothetical protein
VLLPTTKKKPWLSPEKQSENPASRAMMTASHRLYCRRDSGSSATQAAEISNSPKLFVAENKTLFPAWPVAQKPTP